MGQGCCKESNEKSKPSLLQKPSDSNYDPNKNDGSQLDYNTMTSGGTLSNNNNRNNKSDTNSNNDNTGGINANPNGNSNGGNIVLTEALLLQQQQRTQAEAERQRVLREEQARLESIVSNAGRDMVPLGGGGGGSGGGDGIGNGLGFAGSAGMGTMAYYEPGIAASITQDMLNHGAGGGFVGGLHAAYRNMDDGHNRNFNININTNITVNTDENDHGNHLTKFVLGRNQIPRTCVQNGVGAVEVLSQRIDFNDFNDCLRNGMRDDDYPVGAAGTGASAGTGGDGMEFLEDVAEQFLASVLCTKEGLFQDIGPIVENLP